MKRILKNIDILGEKVSIMIKNEDKIKTKIGGIFTLLMVAIIIVFSWFIGNDIIYKEKPISSGETLIDKSYKEINLNANNFPIAIQLCDQDGNTVNGDKFINIGAQVEYFKLKNSTYEKK